MPELAMTFPKDPRFLTLFHTTGASQKQKKKGAGTKMLDDLKKKGKPVTPKLEEMALWLDSLDTSTMDDGQVSQDIIVCAKSPVMAVKTAIDLPKARWRSDHAALIWLVLPCV